MTNLDGLALLGFGVYIGGWLALWWQVAIIQLGAVLFLVAVGLTLLRRRERAGGERHEG